MTVKQTKKKAAKKKSEKIFTEVDAFELIKEHFELTNEVDNLQKDLTNVTKELNEIGLKEWIQLYEKIGENPKSITLKSNNRKEDESATVDFEYSDRYIKIENPILIKSLTDKYGTDVVEKVETKTLNPDLVKKYENLIAQFIQKSKYIDEEDRNSIFKTETKYTIKKGTIDKLVEIKEKTKVPISEIIKDISPVFAIKRSTIIEVDNED